MRLDRLITLGLVAPFHRVTRRLRTLDHRPATCDPVLPILMYHSISDDPEPGVSPYYRVCTSPGRFAEHMEWLADWGYRGVTLSEGLAWLERQGQGAKGQGQKAKGKGHGARSEGQEANYQPPNTNPQSPTADCRIPSAELSGPKSQVQGQGSFCEETLDLRPATCDSQAGTCDALPKAKPVALTFDDGFRDFYTAAFPVLRRHGFLATMYVPTAFIAGARAPACRNTGPGDRRREYLVWDEVAQLHRAGIEFGSHTVTHPKLVKLCWSGVETEVARSKCDLEGHLGSTVASFAYPFAFPQADRPFVTRFRDLLRQYGYASCVTTEIGRVVTGDDSYGLKRLPANDADDAPLLAAKIRGDYDWLAAPQHVFKALKSHRPGAEERER